MKYFIAILMLFTAIDSEAATDRNAVSRPTQRHFSSQGHDGFSPFPPPPADDTVFIVDRGSDLDTDCTFRSSGPLVIHLLVTRYVAPVSTDGTLPDKARSALISAGFLSRYAHLRLPAYDVDVRGDPTDPNLPPEVDHVFFNDHDLGTLTGDDDI